jgi:hypothetical protein
MLTYLKRVRHVKGRFVNVALCSMQILVPFASVVSLFVNIT